ncbi:hypothetical protein GJ633_03975 [Halorubrum sp. CBA1125]|uniref:DUF7389 domain-containing protein n=1 Tax=Halorubrum sp. CBA1125 TaxID=2668072 RepID=UPI0012E95C9C|nr:hypothetical protein [Halorubrum sp. CBA1125]MUW13909.1 hypothetical protein [Halorubrum sp. CBA1125]
MSDLETKIVMTRGTGSADKEKITTKVTAPDVETLSERVDDVREEMEEWADDFRKIDPERPHRPPDNQSQLGGEA